MVNVEFNGKNYLYQMTNDPVKGFDNKYGAYQIVSLDNKGKLFTLVVFNDEKNGVTLSNKSILMWFR